MNITLVIPGLIEISISIIATLFIFLLSFKIFSLLTRKIDETKEILNNNIAISIVVASFIFGIMLLIRPAVESSMDTLGAVLSAKQAIAPDIILAISRVILFFFISSIFAFIILLISIKSFTLLTVNIDEWAEIKKNNIAISLIICTLIISAAFLLAKPLSTILDGFIPAPELFSGQLKKAQPFFNWAVIGKGSIELVITFVSIILVFFFSFTGFKLMTKKIDENSELKSNNIAMAILLASFILGMMILISAAVTPANKTLYFALNLKNEKAAEVIFAILKVIGFFIGTAIFTFFLLQLAMRLFMALFSKKDEMQAIKNKNIAMAIIIGVFIISASIILSHGVNALLNAFISTPKVGTGII